jgi:hypothetical protein
MLMDHACEYLNPGYPIVKNIDEGEKDFADEICRAKQDAQWGQESDDDSRFGVPDGI